MISKILRHARALAHELRASCRLSGDFESSRRLWIDAVKRRLMRFRRMSDLNNPREIHLKDDTPLIYRFNRGDLQSFREVWMDELYRLPFPLQPKIVVDLGANIGLTSVWFHKRFGCELIVAVEPDEGNAQIAVQNFALNSVPGEILWAAIGPNDGHARFQSYPESNIGHLKRDEDATHDSGLVSEVRVISMATVLKHIPEGRQIDLLKVDIEGGEGALFDGDLAWLDRIDSIIIELHADKTDIKNVAHKIAACGFRAIPEGAAFPDSLPAFVRSGSTYSRERQNAIRHT